MATHEQAPSRRLRSLLDRMSDGFLAVDEDWIVTACNDRARWLLDRQSEDVVGTELWTLLPSSVEDQFADRCRHAMAADTSEAFEVDPDEVDPTLSVRVFPRTDGLSIYLRNVSLSRRREADLTRYVTVVEAVSDGVIVFGESGTVTMVNDALETLFDVNRGTVIGRDVDELGTVSPLTGDDIEEITDAVESIRTGGAREATLELHVPDDVGDQLVVDLRLVPLPGAPEGSVAGVVRDVTERHEHERIVTALHDATRRLFRADDPEDICATAVHTAAEVLDLQISGIWLLDEEYNRLEPIAATAGAHEIVGGLPQFVENEGLVWEVFRAGEPSLFGDLDDESGVYNPETPIVNELIVPIGDRGVLMAGETIAGSLDEHDLDLAAILAANTEVALERADRERLLRSRADELDHRDGQLSTLAHVLDEHFESTLDDLRRHTDDETVLEYTDELAGWLDDARFVAGTRGADATRSECTLSEIVERARSAVEEPPAVDSITDGTLRARRDGMERLLVALLRIATRHDDATVDVGLVYTPEPDPHRPDGIVVEDDRPPLPESDRTRPFDGDATDPRIGMELAVASEIAHAHGWQLDVTTTEGGMAVRVTGITTLTAGSVPDSGQ